MFFRFFGVIGLCCITVFATITANIEVLLLVNAFGMEQTLGNILFAYSFLCTDIASEIYGKKAANKIVNIGICTSLLFMVLTQTWLMYIPSPNDVSAESLRAIFSNTPRMMIVGLLVYAVCQRFDVWMYHKVWEKTDKISKDHKKYLWLRNNGSTMLSQLINSFLFTFGAFYGVHNIQTLINIFLSSYIIFLVLAVIDTIFLYWARYINDRLQIQEQDF